MEKTNRYKPYNFFAMTTYLWMGIIYAGNQTLLYRIAMSAGWGEGGIGLLASANFVGALVTVFVFGMFADRSGKRRCAVIASCLVFMGALIMCFANSFYFYMVSFALIGCGTGGLESMIVSLSQDNNREQGGRYISAFNLLFCVGAVAAPPLVSFLIPDEGFRAFYIAMSVCSATVMLFFLSMRKIDRFAIQQKTERAEPLAILRFLKNPVMLLSVISMLIYLACESTVVYWSDTYFITIGAEKLSALSISVFWFSMIVGRFVASLVRDIVKIVPRCFLFGGVGTALIVVLPGGYLKLAAVFFAGAMFGPVYGGLSFLGGRQYPAQSGAAYSLIVLAANVGGALSQPLVGMLSQAFSVAEAYIVAAIAAAVMFPVVLLAIKVEKKRALGDDEQ